MRRKVGLTYTIRYDAFRSYVVTYSDGTDESGYPTGYDAHSAAQSVGAFPHY